MYMSMMMMMMMMMIMMMMTVAYWLRPAISEVLFFDPPFPPFFGGDVGRGKHDDDSQGGLFLTTPGFVI